MTDGTSDEASFRSLLNTVGRFVVWIGSSASAIGLLLSSFGYLVESAYFSTFGLSRGMLDLTPTEYIMSGGQFIIGVIPLAYAGGLSFIFGDWWTLLALATIVALGKWRRWGASYRWLVFAAVMALWLAVNLLELSATPLGKSADQAVARLTFVTVVAVLYVYFEHYLGCANAPSQVGQPQAMSYLPRVPFFFVLFVALMTLPYARGAWALKRELPIVELSSKDAQALCRFAEGTAPSVSRDCEKHAWQLIQIGKDKAVLRNLVDKKTYIAPIATTAMLRILPRKEVP